MGVFSRPPAATRYSFRTGDEHQGVAAIQLVLNAVGATPPIAVDGHFGTRTATAVVRYQRNRGLTADGVVGPKTQERIALGFEQLAEKDRSLPDQLLRGVVEGESGNLIAAVNWSVAGGVDCGFTQRRVTGPPFVESAVRRAFDSKAQIGLLATQLADRHAGYRARGIPGERAWRIAVLAHNWPAGAGVLVRGDQLSDTRIATWVPDGVRFTDGAPVRTFRDWSEWYAMGSKAHRHAGHMVRFTFGVPN